MPLQSAKNVAVRFKVEAAFNTAPGVGSAEELRFTPGAGLNLKAATIRSNEQRSDALMTMGRMGSRSVDGTYSAEVSKGSHDTIYEAVMRSTWAAAVAITQATMTSITTTTSTIVAAGGDWMTQGVRVGDVVVLTGHLTAANNNILLRVKTVTTSTITVHGTPLTVDAVADLSFTLTIQKKLKNGATPTKRTFYVEQNNVDIDGSQLFGGCKFTGFKITGTPDGMAVVEFTMLGASMATVTGAGAPYYTSPTTFTSDPMVFADAKISLGGTDIAIGTAFELNYQISAATQPVVGTVTSPDVFDNDVTMSGSFSLIRQDFTYVTGFTAETEFALHILLALPTGAPPQFLSIFVPRIKFTSADAQLGGDGAMIESLPFQTGAQAVSAATGYDATLLTICTTT